MCFVNAVFMHPYRVYNSFAELALANGTSVRSACVRTHNSELAAL